MLEARSLSRRALVADDDPIYRDVASAALVDAGYESDTAADGREALAHLDANRYDVAIIDLTMPGIDGFEVIRRTRTGGVHENVPIIVMTGLDDVASIRRAYDMGATSFLAKPINWNLFTHHVEFVAKVGETEADLRDATRASQLLMRLKSDLISVAANEFRGPLTTVYGFVELLRKEVFGPLGNPTYKTYIQDVSGCIEQLNVALLKMLQSGEALAPSLSLREELLDLSSFLSDVLHSVELKAQRRSVMITGDIAAGTPRHIKGDRTLLGQALKSLIENAVQFAPRNTSVSIEACRNSAGGIAFHVHDSGPAIAREQLQELLTPAARTMSPISATKERCVGMSIGKILVEAHQGNLEITSTPGEGTTARLILPQARLVERAA